MLGIVSVHHVFTMFKPAFMEVAAKKAPDMVVVNHFQPIKLNKEAVIVEEPRLRQLFHNKMQVNCCYYYSNLNI
jgi:hypothetical protein